MSNPEATDEKVPDQPERRQFTPEYKLRILQEIDKRRGKSKACRRPRAYCGIHPVRKGGSVPYARYTQPPANPWRSAIAASGKTVAS